VSSKLEALTPRQHNVLHYLVAGYTNPEIAEELVISVKTVEAHVSQVSPNIDSRFLFYYYLIVYCKPKKQI